MICAQSLRLTRQRSMLGDTRLTLSTSKGGSGEGFLSCRSGTASTGEHRATGASGRVLNSCRVEAKSCVTHHACCSCRDGGGVLLGEGDALRIPLPPVPGCWRLHCAPCWGIGRAWALPGAVAARPKSHSPSLVCNFRSPRDTPPGATSRNKVTSTDHSSSLLPNPPVVRAGVLVPHNKFTQERGSSHRVGQSTQSSTPCAPIPAKQNAYILTASFARSAYSGCLTSAGPVDIRTNKCRKPARGTYRLPGWTSPASVM